MLDIKFVRENVGAVEEALKKRNYDLSLTDFLSLEEERRGLLKESEELRNKRNTVSEEIGRLKREKKDVADLVNEMKSVSDRIKELDDRLRGLDEKMTGFLLNVPNMPHESVPVGKDETENVVVRTWGEPREFDFPPLNHWDIAEILGIIAGVGLIVGGLSMAGVSLSLARELVVLVGEVGQPVVETVGERRVDEAAVAQHLCASVERTRKRGAVLRLLISRQRRTFDGATSAMDHEGPLRALRLRWSCASHRRRLSRLARRPGRGDCRGGHAVGDLASRKPATDLHHLGIVGIEHDRSTGRHVLQQFTFRCSNSSMILSHRSSAANSAACSEP